MSTQTLIFLICRNARIFYQIFLIANGNETLSKNSTTKFVLHISLRPATINFEPSPLLLCNQNIAL